MTTKILATAALATPAALGTASAADLPMPAPVYKAFPAAAGVVVLHSQKTTQMVSTELVWRFNWSGGRY